MSASDSPMDKRFDWETPKCGSLRHCSTEQGPAIEDYAAWIAAERPDGLILDGPATYLHGPFQSEQNLTRALTNCARAVRATKLAILDHHLAREPNFCRKASAAFSTGAITGAEAVGKEPLLFRLARWGALPEKTDELDMDLLLWQRDLASLAAKMPLP